MAHQAGSYGAIPEIAFTEFTLDNGLHVILHEDHSTPIVAVGVMYHVGSKDDAPGRKGFAHFFEHLLFEGSANIPRGEFSRHVERAGGQLNANTSSDRTYYHEVLPSNRLTLGLWLERERMLHARVDRQGVDTQRDVVREEWRQMYENRPYGNLLPEVLRRAYSDHPYQWPVIGHMPDLETAGEKDFRDFYERYYVPCNAVLVLAGDFDPNQARELVHHYFDDIPRGAEVPRPLLPEAGLEQEVRAVVHDRVELPAVVQAYRIPPVRDPAFMPVDMLLHGMSSGHAARLKRALKDRHRLAVQVGGFALPFEQGGLAMIFAIANTGVDPCVLERAMDEEIQRLRETTMEQAELDAIRTRARMEAVQGMRRMAGVAHRLATAHTLQGGAHAVRDELARMTAITVQDIRQAALDHLDPARRVLLHYLPGHS